MLDVVDLLLGVTLGIHIELTCSRLKLIGLGCAAALGNHLVDAALYVGPLNIVNFQQILENAFVSFLGLVDEVLIPHDIDRVQLYKVMASLINGTYIPWCSGRE